jgi:NAD(P)-dependent dehydrogenase (short-subunit alcohol dehydrogenase family)
MTQHPALAAGNVAIITGAASGIGLAAAKKFATLGMKIVMADRNGELLEESATAVVAPLCANGSSDVATLVVNVAEFAQVEHLRDAAYARFGRVDVLMNNAGIGIRAGSWDGIDAWHKTLDVNLWGIINGVQAFTQSMLDQHSPALIINTGSKQGITCPPGNTPYNVSKAAVKALTEGLQHSLRNEPGSQVSAHLLVPGFVYTGMMKAHIPEKPTSAWTPEDTIDYMLTRLAEGDFYIICPDNEVTREMDSKRVLWAAGDIANNRPALSRWHPDYQQDFADFMAGK